MYENVYDKLCKFVVYKHKLVAYKCVTTSLVTKACESKPVKQEVSRALTFPLVK